MATLTAPRLVNRSAPIAHRIASARRSLVTVEFARRLAITLALAVALFGALLLLDWLTDLSLEARRVGLWTVFGITGLAALWTILSLITQRRDDEQIALMVERKRPQFDSRLISAVQFAAGKAAVPAGAPAEMVEAMVTETETEARRTPFKSIVDRRRVARATLLLIAVLMAAGIGAFAGRGVLPVLVERAFGKSTPIPRETRIVEATGELRVGIGDPVELAFQAEGVLPEEGTLTLRYDSGRRETAPLRVDAEQPGRYVAVIEDVPESFSFRARINDAITDKTKVTALERPAIDVLAATQTYPAFTGLPTSSHAPGDFALFPGSDVRFTLTATKPLASATLTFLANGATLDLPIEGSDPTQASGTFIVPPEELGGFTVELLDREEMRSKDRTVYRVTLLADRAPEIRITFPRRAEELVTRRARVLVRFEATDRFGIAEVNLRYARGGDSPLGTVPVTIPDGTPKAIGGEVEWDLPSLQPPVTEGDILEYWLEAADQNSAGANIGTSEHLTLKVVTPEEKRADLLGRASDAIGGVGEATADQERINKALEKLIRDSVK